MLIHTVGTADAEIAGCLETAAQRTATRYRYRKVSEWVFDVLFSVLLNFGQWVTSLAWGLRAGYECFHNRRTLFARARYDRPPVWMIDEETATRMQCPTARSECIRHT